MEENDAKLTNLVMTQFQKNNHTCICINSQILNVKRPSVYYPKRKKTKIIQQMGQHIAYNIKEHEHYRNTKLCELFMKV